MSASLVKNVISNLVPPIVAIILAVWVISMIPHDCSPERETNCNYVEIELDESHSAVTNPNVYTVFISRDEFGYVIEISDTESGETYSWQDRNADVDYRLVYGELWIERYDNSWYVRVEK